MTENETIEEAERVFHVMDNPPSYFEETQPYTATIVKAHSPEEAACKYCRWLDRMGTGATVYVCDRGQWWSVEVTSRLVHECFTETVQEAEQATPDQGEIMNDKITDVVVEYSRKGGPWELVETFGTTTMDHTDINKSVCYRLFHAGYMLTGEDRFRVTLNDQEPVLLGDPPEMKAHLDPHTPSKNSLVSRETIVRVEHRNNIQDEWETIFVYSTDETDDTSIDWFIASSLFYEGYTYNTEGDCLYRVSINGGEPVSLASFGVADPASWGEESS